MFLHLYLIQVLIFTQTPAQHLPAYLLRLPLQNERGSRQLQIQLHCLVQAQLDINLATCTRLLTLCTGLHAVSSPHKLGLSSLTEAHRVFPELVFDNWGNWGPNSRVNSHYSRILLFLSFQPVRCQLNHFSC